MTSSTSKTTITSSLRARALAVAALLGLGAGFLGAGTAYADPTYHLVDADHANDGGVFYRNSPRWTDTSHTPGLGLYYGENGQLICGTWGDPVGPYANRRWHKVQNLSRNVGVGWLPDRYFDTPNNANQPTPGERECSPADMSDVVLASAPKPPTTINGTNVGVPQNDVHQWGSCRVQDFKGGPLGWVIVSYSAGSQIVRNGMLFGWFDQGGAPGRLGCPTNNEYTFAGGVRQDFQHGSLFWEPGLDHARLLSQGPGNFSNAAIANYLLDPSRLNHNLGVVHGECRQAADDAVATASGGSMDLGVALGTSEASHYQAGFQRLGAVQVDPGEATKGDIVQVSDDPNSSKLHTYVIVQNLGNSNFIVVDSNHNLDHTVREYQRSFNYAGDAAISMIWRLGKI